MPELPEVETIKNQLSQELPLTVKSVKLSDVHESIVHTDLKPIKNKTIQSISRQGKMLIFNISDELKMLSHLGMTGTWRISRERLKEKHNHIELKCLDKHGDIVFYSYVDPRRFGHLYLLEDSLAQEKIDQLGPDLTKISLEQVKEFIKKFPNRKIKVHLLDQKYFAGSGNYIASEICARAKVLPQRENSTLKDNEIKRIHKAISIVINQNIEMGGATFQGGYQDAYGDKGQGVANLVVFYQDTCQMCKKGKVVKIILAQRGTYYCPLCQK